MPVTCATASRTGRAFVLIESCGGSHVRMVRRCPPVPWSPWQVERPSGELQSAGGLWLKRMLLKVRRPNRVQRDPIAQPLEPFHDDGSTSLGRWRRI